MNSRIVQALTDWFLPLADPTTASAHVYALAQAGGGCTSFSPLAAALAPDLTVWAMNLPGRQARFTEPARTDLAPLLDDLTGAAARHTPAVLFGHCSGALLAFLLARRLSAAGRAPAALVVASYPAPDLARPAPALHLADSADFWREIISYGGVAEHLAAEPDFREVFEEPLRADYELLAGYAFTEERPLNVPVVVLTGADDVVLPADEIAGWRRHTTADFRVRTVPGGHWLLDTSLDAVTAVLRDVATISGESRG